MDPLTTTVLQLACKDVQVLGKSALPSSAVASGVRVHVRSIFYVELLPALFHDDIERERCIDCLRWLVNGDVISTVNATRNPLLPSRSKRIHCELEIGPRLNFKTAFCTNASSILANLGCSAVQRIERSHLYLLEFPEGCDKRTILAVRQEIKDHLMDRVLEFEYDTPINRFQHDVPRQTPFLVPVIQEGRTALSEANSLLSLGFDEKDLDFYTDLFVNHCKRNPTNVECLDLAQSNSEHSRHWFFNGRLVIDGEEIPESLFRMVKATQQQSNDNNIIKFSDNSSAIEGFSVPVFRCDDPSEPSAYTLSKGKRHPIFTAETHNFPTAVEPFSGATTGTGGRIRDVQATGRGAHVIAGTAGYSFGNCCIPGFVGAWENEKEDYPGSFAPPLKVLIEASNGASDYGNKFGEPLISGFSRSFGHRMSHGERREYVKPIMFTGGIGSIDEAWIKKFQPEVGMKVAKIGGPVYRIGLGGGAASSTVVQGSKDSEIDFNAVQRGDAEMEQKMNRVLRACIEMQDNPILSVHDQGAGGNANVLKEIVDPAGAVIKADSFGLGDATLSIHELWVAEYQESVAVLIADDKVEVLQKLAHRERCAVDVVGEITCSGKILLEDFSSSVNPAEPRILPVDLQLDLFLSNIPKKEYLLERIPSSAIQPNSRKTISRLCPDFASLRDSLHRVLQLPAVASKRFLTNKVDRSVTGLIAQQQCVGPLHTPLADVAVIALSHFDTVGSATAIGEQPIKMLFDVKKGARMTVIESLTNLMFAKISSIRDVKCSGNWMWPAKLPGEGAALYDACQAMCDLMKDLGVAVDGGKDSLSMAAKCGDEVVKSPGTLVVSTYAPCPDIRKVVTPDLKVPSGKGDLFWIDLSRGNRRLGGSAFAQANGFLDMLSDVPDIEIPNDFVAAFEVTQALINDGKVTAGHDISDGGLVVCLLEMAFAGNVVCDVNLPEISEYAMSPEYTFFSEEVGWILETNADDRNQVQNWFDRRGVCCRFIGHSYRQMDDVRSLADQNVHAPFISINSQLAYGNSEVGIGALRSIWEEFSYQIERLQCVPDCADSEKSVLLHGANPVFSVGFSVDFDGEDINVFRKGTVGCPRVAVIREEGSNGDREMAAALYLVGFEVWDVNVQDLLDGQVDLGTFVGLVFVGGFSYADVFGSAKGWAAVLAFNSTTRKQIEDFFERPDTFTLGVCNGCQLLTALGLIGLTATTIDVYAAPVSLKHNLSGRFESRFATVKIRKSNAMMLRGMEGSQLGVWSAHGEGRFEFRDNVLETLRATGCLAVEFVDSSGCATEVYPLNPNGSPEGIAGICSENGRHLVMMPHPERSVLAWQWPWMPTELSSWPKDAIFSPWIKIFRNAYEWCTDSNSF